MLFIAYYLENVNRDVSYFFLLSFGSSLTEVCLEKIIIIIIVISSSSSSSRGGGGGSSSNGGSSSSGRGAMNVFIL